MPCTGGQVSGDVEGRSVNAERHDRGSRRPAVFDQPAGTRPTEAAPVRRPVPVREPEAEEFTSILGGVPDARVDAPEFFVDLNLDQIVQSVTAGRDEYDLRPFFHVSLHDTDAVRFRQEVFRDLEDEGVLRHVVAFAERMRTMREQLRTAGKLRYRYQKERLFLDAASTYCEAAGSLLGDLSDTKLRSRGFKALRRFLEGLVRSRTFVALREEIASLSADLSAVRYCMHIKGGRISVRKAATEIDYTAEVEKTFEKFRRGAVESHLCDIPDYLEMNHIEAAVLEMVARLYPETFGALDAFFENHQEFADPKVTGFDREVQFYLAWLAYTDRFRRAGLAFCYPEVSPYEKAIRCVEGFDLALAGRLLTDKAPVVRNDFHLEGPERIFVVTGPNQGGKTTFARMFGQLHYLAGLGCPIPGRAATLFLFDRLFTHFEKEEDVANLRGKLEDDLIRVHRVLQEASPRSIVIMNEIFTSTTLHDALFLGRKVMESIIRLDLIAVCVTFVDELASLGEKTVSLTSMVDPDNPARRTFKIIRRPADGRSHAMAIARLHGLAYADLKKRLKP
ncbi:MAG TPA: DNA mismatch repair protein MutS [Rhizobiales bacterium]|nr:DNA mismatch repair protein MutS [Hyphomicrobiales bacterium]